MRRRISLPVNIRKNIRTDGGIDGTDLIYVFLAALVSFVLKGRVHSWLEIPFVVFVVAIAFVLILPNREVVNAKNYEVLKMLFLKDSNVYHALARPKKKKKESEDQ